MKKDLQQEILKRKVGTPKRWVQFVYKLIALLTTKKMNCQYNIIDDIRDEKGPAILIQNHLSRFDHYFITLATYPKKLTYMVAYNEFFRKGQSTFLKLFRCIPKRNSVTDYTAIRNLKRYVSQGNTIVIAPEGFTSVDGKNHPVEPGSGKLMKMLNAPIYYAEIRGQYLTATKTCTDIRNGRCQVTIKKLFTAEEVQAMEPIELERKFNELFSMDDYEWQKEQNIKWDNAKNITKDLEDLCYRCPKCGKIFTMHSFDNVIECSECGNGASMDEYYKFHPYEGSIIPDTPSKWSDYEREQIIKEIHEDPNFKYVEKVKLGILPKDHIVKNGGTSELAGEGTITVDHNGLHYEGTKNNEPFNIDLDYTEFHTVLGSTDFSYFFIYKNGEYFDLFPQERRSGYHVMLIVEEMHRMHVNTYKALPQYQYMYKDYE